MIDSVNGREENSKDSAVATGHSNQHPLDQGYQGIRQCMIKLINITNDDKQKCTLFRIKILLQEFRFNYKFLTNEKMYI